MSDNTINALDNAAEEAVVYQAETQVRLLNEARKRKWANKEGEPETASFNVFQKEVDDSDHIEVIGNRKSLMFLTRNLGLYYHGKSYKTMNAIEKYYAKLCLNSIIDINDSTFIKLLNLSNQAHQDLKTRFSLPQTRIPQPNQKLKEIYREAEKMPLVQKHRFYTISSFDHVGDNRKKILITAHIYNLLSYKNADIQKWKSLSEWSLIIKIWSNIFEILFENTNVNLIWGDTVNEAFKVDLRFCLSVEGKYHDISNIEFKKHGKEPRLVKSDGCKILVEAKTILNQIIKHHNLDFKKSKQKKVINGQICGLKAVFTELWLEAPGCYMTNPFGKTIKFPPNDGRAMKFMEEHLEQLFCYKDFVVEETQKLRDVLLQDNCNFGSQSTVEEQDFMKKTYVISEKAILFPKLHDDFYKP